MKARRAVDTARGLVRGADLLEQRCVRPCTPRRPPLHPCRVASWGAIQEPAHGGIRFLAGSRSRIGTLRRDRVRLPSEPDRGFERISRSILSSRFSRLSRVSSARSAVVSPLPPRRFCRPLVNKPETDTPPYDGGHAQISEFLKGPET